MFNPHVLQVTKMVENMVNHHKEELYQASLVWEDHKIDGDGNIQVVPRLDLYFKF